jgi:hypothetical protein
MIASELEVAQYSVRALRDRLRDIARNHHPKRLGYLPQDPIESYHYWYRRGLGLWLALADAQMHYAGVSAPDKHRWRDYVSTALDPDLRRLPPCACLVAWLTTDGYRLHEEWADGLVDLKYGLVKRHFTPILRFALFEAGITTEREMARLPQGVLRRTHRRALQEAMWLWQGEPEALELAIERERRQLEPG